MGKIWTSRQSSLADVVAEAESLRDTIEMLSDEEFEEMEENSALYDELYDFIRTFKYNV